MYHVKRNIANNLMYHGKCNYSQRPTSDAKNVLKRYFERKKTANPRRSKWPINGQSKVFEGAKTF